MYILLFFFFSSIKVNGEKDLSEILMLTFILILFTIILFRVKRFKVVLGIKKTKNLVVFILKIFAGSP